MLALNITKAPPIVKLHGDDGVFRRSLTFELVAARPDFLLALPEDIVHLFITVRGIMVEQIQLTDIPLGRDAKCIEVVLVTPADAIDVLLRRVRRIMNEYVRAFAEFKADVEAHEFPTQEHTIEMPDEEWRAIGLP